MFVDWEVPLSRLRVSVRSLLFVVQVWSTEGEAWDSLTYWLTFNQENRNHSRSFKSGGKAPRY